MSFKDHFSGHAAVYAAARPRYPAALFDWLVGQCPQRELVWDAGCGNGQASVALAERFASVFATDPSATQIAAAEARPQLRYAVEPAEQCTLAAHSADLVTVAQALHWFDHARFYPEVRRVLKPGGLFAAWGYQRSSVEPAVDAVFAELYEVTLGEYWPPERRHIESGYRTLPFPFEERPAPVMELRCDWDLPQYLAYLSSWSASQRYLKTTGRDAVAEFAPTMARAWGDPERIRRVCWPMVLRLGQA